MVLIGQSFSFLKGALSPFWPWRNYLSINYLFTKWGKWQSLPHRKLPSVITSHVTTNEAILQMVRKENVGNVVNKLSMLSQQVCEQIWCIPRFLWHKVHVLSTGPHGFPNSIFNKTQYHWWYICRTFEWNFNADHF